MNPLVPTIDHNIPVWPRAYRNNWSAEVLDAMNPGDSLIVNVTQAKVLSRTARLRGYRIATRKVDGKGIRFWLLK